MRPSAAHYIDQAYELQRLEKYDLALAAVTQALEVDPNSAEAHECGAWTLRAQRKLPEAEAAARAALALDPNLTDGHYVLALILWGRGRYAEAEAAFRATLVAPVGSRATHLTWFANFMVVQQLRPLIALDLLEQALAFNPNLADTHHTLGLTHLALGNRAAAYAAYTEALRLTPVHVAAHLDLALMDLNDGRGAAAIAHCNAALAARPGDARARTLLAQALKTRYPLYGWLLKSSALWRRDDRRGRWIFASLLGLCGINLALSLIGTPAAKALISWTCGTWIIGLLAAASGYRLMDPLLDWLVLRDPRGRYAVDRASFDYPMAITSALFVVALPVLIVANLLAAPRAVRGPLQAAVVASIVTAIVFWGAIRGRQGGQRAAAWLLWALLGLSVAALTLSTFKLIPASTGGLAALGIIVSLIGRFMLSYRIKPGYLRRSGR